MKINILWFLLPMVAVLCDSVVVISVGLHLKSTAKKAVLEAASEVQQALINDVVPILLKAILDNAPALLSMVTSAAPRAPMQAVDTDTMPTPLREVGAASKLEAGGA